MAECEICGRQIRTGRKYCWEHRHTSQAEAIRGERVLNEADNAYIDYQLKTKFNVNVITLIGFLIFVCGFVFAIIFNRVSLILMGVVTSFIWIAYISIWLKDRAREKIYNQIVNRDKEYIKFVKEYVGAAKEHKEFRRSLLR